MDSTKTLLIVSLIIMGALGAAAVYSHSNSDNGDDGPPVIEADGTPPQNIDAYTIIVEDETYLCIEHESRMDNRGYYGLSCTPIDTSATSDE